MASSLALLAMSSTDALRQMVEEKLITGVTLNDLTLALPVVDNGARMRSRIGLSSAAGEGLGLPFFGTVNFYYSRLDLSQAFAGIDLEFQYASSFSSGSIASKLSDIFGFVFEFGDYVAESVILNDPEVVYNFKAGANSKRYIGSVNIRIYQPDDEEGGGPPMPV